MDSKERDMTYEHIRGIRMIRKKTGLIVAALLLAAALCTGCGREQGRENIDLGMAAVEALDYNTALTHFEQAIVADETPELLYRGQGLAYMGLSQYAEAAASFEKALSYSGLGVTELDYDVNYYPQLRITKTGNRRKPLESMTRYWH